MRSITSCTEGAIHCSCTEGALHVPQGTLSFKTGGVSNYERSVGFASVQSLGAFIIRHPCLTRLCGFSHPHSSTKKRRPYSLGTVSLKISTIAEGASRCVASLHAPKVRFIVHAPKVRFMCRKAHLVLKPAGCRIMNALLALHPCKALGRS